MVSKTPNTNKGLFFLNWYGKIDKGTMRSIANREAVLPKYFLKKYKTLGIGLGAKKFDGLKASQLPISRKPPVPAFTSIQDAIGFDTLFIPSK